MSVSVVGSMSRSRRRTSGPWILQATGWLAGLAILVGMVLVFRPHSPSWALMWLLAFTIFSLFKLLTLFRLDRQALARLSAGRLVGYLFLWPGMRPQTFFVDAPASPVADAPGSPSHLWRSALANLALGAVLVGTALWGLPGSTPDWLRAWTGMVGFVFLVQLGSFDLVTASWRAAGVPAEKLFDFPARSRSLAEFWGRRWNRIFSDFARSALFRPLARHVGTAAATLAVFLLSGVAHELLFTIPAGAGYGGPTLYFVIQGLLILVENRPPCWGWLRRHPVPAWSLTMLALLLPLPLLFSEAFVTDVVLPFFRALGGNG